MLCQGKSFLLVLAVLGYLLKLNKGLQLGFSAYFLRNFSIKISPV